jgi:hypothetical protein
VFKRTNAIRGLLMLAALVSTGSALAASRDDELLVDPTVPLSIAFGSSGADSSDDSGGSSFFGLFEAFTSYELSSILIRAEDRIAVINEERVRVGDKIGSAVVAAIEADHVALNVDGEIQTLALYENSIKTPVKGNE